MSSKEITKFDKKFGEFWDNREDLTNIFRICLQRFNQTELYKKEEDCVRNYTEMIKEARVLVQSQLINDFD